MEEPDPVGDLAGELHLVRRQQHRHPLVLELTDHLEHVADRWVLNPRYAVIQEKVDGYRLVNGRLSLPLAFLGDGLEAFVAGENLAGERYEHRPGYPMPGRSWTLGLAVRL